MVVRIHICGAHSTGKTTLLNDVIPHLNNFTVVTEVARNIIKNNGWSRDMFDPAKNPKIFQELNEEIIIEQIRKDDEMTSSAIDFISDRGLEPIVYCDFYVGKEARLKILALPGVKKWIERLRSSLIFVVSPHKECIKEDGVRLQSNLEELHKFNAALVKELEHQGIKHIKIDKLDRQERIKIVLENVRRLSLDC